MNSLLSLETTEVHSYFQSLLNISYFVLLTFKLVNGPLGTVKSPLSSFQATDNKLTGRPKAGEC
jgi:hypothetical protein